jgi:hypothetical protein
MKPLLWRMLGVGLLTVVVLGVARGGCRAVPDEAEGVREDAGAEPDPLENWQRSQRLTRLQQVILWAVDQREALTSDLIAGRLTLLETAAGFRAINAVKVKYFKPYPLSFPGKTEEEQLCRQVIAYTEQHLGDDKPGRAAVLARLERELREYLECQDTVCLPEPPPLRPPLEP